MEWWEKEYLYEKRYRNGKVSTNIWKYIPDRLDDAVDSAYVDGDGYWIYLNDGYTAYDGGEACGIIHTYTVSDLKEDIKTIRKGGFKHE